MKITRVEAVPLTATTVTGTRRSVHAVVQVVTDEGLIGISRCMAPLAPLINNQLGPLIVGQDPRNAERLWAKMYASVAVAGTGVSAREAVTGIGTLDIALWDLKGKILNTPLHRLLGGYRDEIPVYADGGMVHRGASGQAKWSEKCVGQGYHSVKYHVMGESADDIVETARQVRKAIGPSVRLMIDVHKLWDPWLAVETARRLEEHDVFWLEEPISWDDQVGGMAYLAASTRINVAAGESEINLYACRDLCAHAGVRILQTDVHSSGGYTAWLKLAAVAHAYHVRISPHGASFPELAAPFVAAVPNGLVVSAFPAGETGELWSKMYREPLDLRDGMIYLRDRPGLGLEFDEQFIARYKA